MITAKLKGGLGNQLYQIAAAYTVSKTYDIDFCINYNFEFGAMQGNHPRAYKDNLYRNFKSTDIKPDWYYVEKQFTYNQIPYLSHDYAIDGYFQSYKYFQRSILDLRKILQFDQRIQSTVEKRLQKFKDEGKHIVGIHSRRGDYINNPHIFPLPSKEYYQEAKAKFDEDNTVFLYCTDDYSSYTNLDFRFDSNNIPVNGGSELLDLCVLSNCDSLIIANSTFSAWATYLIKDKDKVYCPKRWLGNENCSDLFDPSWIKL